MATITVRNLDDALRDKLRVRAAEHGRSMEAEARVILDDALNRTEPQLNVAQAFRELGRQFGGIQLDLPPRSDDPGRPAPFADVGD